MYFTFEPRQYYKMYQETLVIHLVLIYMITIKGKWRFSFSLGKMIFIFFERHDDNMHLSHAWLTPSTFNT